MVIKMEAIIIFYAFLVGTFLGSFANVLIYRLPQKTSLWPRSKCPHCGEKIPWYRNIPLFTYLLLKGRAACCHKKIPSHYFFVELISGLFFVYLRPENFQLISVLNSVFLASIFICFITHFVIDCLHHLLLDKINLYLLLLFSVRLFFYGHLKSLLLGGLIGFLVPYIVAKSYFMLKKVHGLGGGDIKLYGVLGLYLGVPGILYNIYFSCLLGAIVGLILILLKRANRKTGIAFGPYILVVASAQIFFPSSFAFLKSFLVI